MEFGSPVETLADTHTHHEYRDHCYLVGHPHHLTQCLTMWGKERTNIQTTRGSIAGKSEFSYLNKFHFELKN